MPTIVPYVGLNEVGFLDQTVDMVSEGVTNPAATTQTPSSTVLGQPITVASSGGPDATDGNGTLKITVFYKEV